MSLSSHVNVKQKAKLYYLINNNLLLIPTMSSPVFLALVEVLWLLCIVYVIRASQLSCLGSSVGKSVRLASTRSCVRIPPKTALGELCCVALSFCYVVLPCLLSD